MSNRILRQLTTVLNYSAKEGKQHLSFLAQIKHRSPDWQELAFAGLSDWEIFLALAVRTAQSMLDRVTIDDQETERLAQELYGRGARRKEKYFWLVIGQPGAGKSTIMADHLVTNTDALLIDSDLIKPLISGFASGLGSNAVHEASFKVAKRMAEMALVNGDNIVYLQVGWHLERLFQLLHQVKSYGYKVGLCLVSVEPQQSVSRTLSRITDTTRSFMQIVDPAYIINVVGTLPEFVFRAAIQVPNLVDEFIHLDTSSGTTTVCQRSIDIMKPGACQMGDRLPLLRLFVSFSCYDVLKISESGFKFDLGKI